MKFRKVLFGFMFLAFSFILVGCSAMGSAENRLEDEGYRLEEVDEDDVDEFQGEEESIKAIYHVYNDNDIWVATIFEFKSAGVLEDIIEEEGESIEDYEELIHKNLFVITLSEEVMSIIKGE